MVYCADNGICEDFSADSHCVCNEYFDAAANCSKCVKNYEKLGIECVRKNVNVAAIAGSVCGVLALAAIIAVIWWLLRRRAVKRANYAKLAGDKQLESKTTDIPADTAA